MDQKQASLLDDMSGIFRGEIRCDSLTRAMYATDGSIYQVLPLAVAAPRDADDVTTLVRYARENQLSLIARGAGSGLAGESLGAGIVVDFSRWMTAIEGVNETSVRVQPGVRLSTLNQRLRPLGRCFAPDPANAAVTTIGGMLGVDAAGSRWIRVGSTRDHVLSVEAVLADGTTHELARESLALLRDAASEAEAEAVLSRRQLVGRLAWLLQKHRELIDERQPRADYRNRAGYWLQNVLSGDAIDFPRLLTGSEGTLALVTAATLQTTPLPAHRVVALVTFATLQAATQASLLLADEQPSACDLLDQRMVTLARELDGRFAALLPAETGAALIVEQSSFLTEPVAERLPRLFERLRHMGSAYQVAYVANEAEEIDFIWSLPQRLLHRLGGLRSESTPIPLVEDITVPPAALYEFMSRAQKILQRYQVSASIYAQTLAGQVHLRPFWGAPHADDSARLESLARDLYQVALTLGGAISGQHGLGLSRSAFLRSQYGPLYRVFREVKDLFDPTGLFNPGKIVTDDPHLTIRNFRPTELVADPVPLQLGWTTTDVAALAGRCHGCGQCRSEEPLGRMCPVFRADPHEDAAPRSKANLMRLAMAGQISQRELASAEMKRVADLCTHCKQCVRECPAEVDIPHLMLEAKAQYVAVEGVTAAEWWLTRLHLWAPWACRLSRLTNVLLRRRSVRWLLERTTGLAKTLTIPPFAQRTFLQRAKPQWLAPPLHFAANRPMVFFVDYFVNFHDPSLGEALMALAERFGSAVHIPKDQTVSGMSFIAAGDLALARQVAQQNVRALAEFARAGCPIVCTEPSAVVCLRDEYPRLLDDPDADAIARQVIDAGSWLTTLMAHTKPPRATLAADCVYHSPCHSRYLGADRAYQQLLAQVEGLQCEPLPTGCSGMAGIYGANAAHRALSDAMAGPVLEALRARPAKGVVTDCSACRARLQSATPRKVVHPLKLLAAAHGIGPSPWGA